MIFGTGVVLMFVGWFTIRAWGGGPFEDTQADYVGASTFFIGLLLSVGSLLHFTAKVLA